MSYNFIRITDDEFKPGMIVCPIDTNFDYDDFTLDEVIDAFEPDQLDYDWLLYRSPVDGHVYCYHGGGLEIEAERISSIEHDHWFDGNEYGVIMKENVPEDLADQECDKFNMESSK